MIKWFKHWIRRQKFNWIRKHLIARCTTSKLIIDKLQWNDPELLKLMLPALDLYKKSQSRIIMDRFTKLMKDFEDDCVQLQKIGESAAIKYESFIGAHCHSVYTKRLGEDLDRFAETINKLEQSVIYDIDWQLRALIRMDDTYKEKKE